TGDFDADGVDEIGLQRPSTGEIFLKWDLGAGSADLSFSFGLPGDIPTSGDWNGDGRDTVAVFRPSDGNWYIKLSNSTGNADHVIGLHPHGGETMPIVGTFE
ncbi:MAG: peptidase C1, partial [Acidimicrobiia bacterium]